MASSQFYLLREFERLLGVLEEAETSSPLPEMPAVRAELNALLLRLREVSE